MSIPPESRNPCAVTAATISSIRTPAPAVTLICSATTRRGVFIRAVLITVTASCGSAPQTRPEPPPRTEAPSPSLPSRRKISETCSSVEGSRIASGRMESLPLVSPYSCSNVSSTITKPRPTIRSSCDTVARGKRLRDVTGLRPKGCACSYLRNPRILFHRPRNALPGNTKHFGHLKGYPVCSSCQSSRMRFRRTLNER